MEVADPKPAAKPVYVQSLKPNIGFCLVSSGRVQPISMTLYINAEREDGFHALSLFHQVVVLTDDKEVAVSRRGQYAGSGEAAMRWVD